MENLDKEIAYYQSNIGDLENKYLGEWVLIHESNLIGNYKTFESAAEEAVKKFGAGPYLIRQVGAKPLILPASVVFNLT